MKRFAKVFDTPDTQVLYFIEHDDDADEMVLHQILVIDEMRIDLAVRFDGDHQEERAYRALDQASERSAADAVEGAKGFVRRNDLRQEDADAE